MSKTAGANLAQYKSVSQRLLAIILRLSRNTHWAAWSLAIEFGVTERTIYRDLNRIRLAGLPIHYDEEKGGYLIDWTAPMQVPTRPHERIIWEDRQATCAQCGRVFVWTARQQWRRHQNIRAGHVEPDTPPICSRRCAGGRRIE